jgi:hypothetical protein
VFPYQKILDAIMLEGEEKISDREAANRCGVSERQTRKARMEHPEMLIDAYLADKLCIGAGFHPATVFGFDAWCLPALSDEDIAELDEQGYDIATLLLTKDGEV